MHNCGEGIEVIEDSTGNPHRLGVHLLDATGRSARHKWNSEKFKQHLPFQAI